MRNSARSWLLTTLTPPTIDRISVDLGGGVGIAIAVAFLNAGGLSNVSHAVVGLGIGGFVAFYIIKKSLEFLRGPVVTTRGPSPRRALLDALLDALLRVTLIVYGTLFMLIVFLIVFIAALPAVFILVFGIWVCLLTQRRVRASRYR